MYFDCLEENKEYDYNIEEKSNEARRKKSCR
jgi:hypothetical protein